MGPVLMLLLLLGLAGDGWAGMTGGAVDVQIRSDNGRLLPLYPVVAQSSPRKVYVEAVKGDHYTIVVRNLLDRRVGVVVAVDGRNIISGKKSWLRSDERMYILEPHQQGEFKGWRTSLDSVNRFYFTDVADSYAAAFRDETAMGVIAAAVYPEVRRPEEPAELSQVAPGASRRDAPSRKSETEGVGTGFGRQERSPARVVTFDPESVPAEKVLVKYEWRSTLCRLGVVQCGAASPPRNRLWDDDGFAPPPPGRS
jgi:hypothetical protein